VAVAGDAGTVHVGGGGVAAGVRDLRDTGGLVTEEPDSPHLSAAELRAEVFLGHADNDRSMTPENIATIESALEDANLTYRSELFEGAAHGYTMADTPAYDQAAAERHFTELFALLDRTVST
jgi:carboxymethylenebutenolidase